MRQVATLIRTGGRNPGSTGQSVGLTIPKEIVKEAELEPGDRVMVSYFPDERAGTITIIKESE